MINDGTYCETIFNLDADRLRHIFGLSCERQKNFYKHHWVVKVEWTINDGETLFQFGWTATVRIVKVISERRSYFYKHHWMVSEAISSFQS